MTTPLNEGTVPAAYKWPPKECPCNSNQSDECQENGCKWERDPSLVPASLRIPRGTVPAAVPADASRPDDIRAAGWTIAVHNDYRLHGLPHTFWLFTKDGHAVKGEGRTDAEALNQIRAALATSAPPPVEAREPSDDTARVERSRRFEVNFEFESLPPVDGMDRIYAEYRKTFGRYPDAFMARVVAQTKEDLFIWWAAHRERIREALVLADPGEGARNRLIDEQMKRDRAATHPKEPTEAREASAEGAEGQQ